MLHTLPLPIFWAFPEQNDIKRFKPPWLHETKRDSSVLKPYCVAYVHSGLGFYVPTFHITQLLGVFHLQQIRLFWWCESQIPQSWPGKWWESSEETQMRIHDENPWGRSYRKWGVLEIGESLAFQSWDMNLIEFRCCGTWSPTINGIWDMLLEEIA